MDTDLEYDLAIVGCGIAGIATAYFLTRGPRPLSVALIDREAPMSYTSAQSGDNYRNWWPHPVMTAFTNSSIDLLESLARDWDNVFQMQRRGYLLATRREDISDLMAELETGYASAELDSIRVHDSESGYQKSASADWASAPRGVDVLCGSPLVQQCFPTLSNDVRNVLHIRRGGDLSGQQLGQRMLDAIRDAGGVRMTSDVVAVDAANEFVISLKAGSERRNIRATRLVNAAGPFVNDVAALLGHDLETHNIYQQKIAFEDQLGTVPRDLPFAIDLDDVRFDWNDEEREFLREDSTTAWLTETQRGGAHCRPEGGDQGRWIKLGWAFNRDTSEPQRDLASEPKRHEQYPEIAMRAAARLQPALSAYLDDFPTRYSHYGGYYTMTAENWPLIGPIDSVPGAYVVGALSGFGSMASCAAGNLLASWILEQELPEFALPLSPRRYQDRALMQQLATTGSRGIL